MDELAKLASSVTPIIIGQPIEQVSLVAHIDRMEEITFLNDWRTTLYDEGNVKRRLIELDLVGEARAKAIARLMAYRQRMKQNYNRRVILKSFQVGDLIWKKVKLVGDVVKLEAPWAGLFKVMQKLRSSAYYLEDEEWRQLERP
ncbi:uncharacterized protein LOC121994677 [Zingiber officinale]|uniref:uncharacterized protein LOC121994677 n=1 Tax=Zingiber officinale TaxID=94328 RepID=UPI001C4CF270|nr:uncharacterized protein LOC121994677 [Zingiber officinale]